MNSFMRRTASSNAAPASLSSTPSFPWVCPTSKGMDQQIWICGSIAIWNPSDALARRATLQSWARSQWQSRAYSGYRNGANWLEKEIVAVGPKGQLWYIAGEPGVYRRVSQPAHVSLIGRLTTVSSWRCGGHRLHCVASEARLLAWARDWVTILSSVAILAALFAWICSSQHSFVVQSLLVFRRPFLQIPDRSVHRHRLPAGP